MGEGCSPEREHTVRVTVLCLEFFSLLQAGISGEDSGEGFISSPVVPFQGPGLH